MDHARPFRIPSCRIEIFSRHRAVQPQAVRPPDLEASVQGSAQGCSLNPAERGAFGIPGIITGQTERMAGVRCIGQRDATLILPTGSLKEQRSGEVCRDFQLVGKIHVFRLNSHGYAGGRAFESQQAFAGNGSRTVLAPQADFGEGQARRRHAEVR
ncbi:MAG: hypothetical protein BWX45_01181 [Deltaproteobacteria bacterium ADurb.Bin002]|nr:MAG: hypothetical protein BWX45_01181 [Deltaproteobacteria bacterium ADurb.Bin002]